MSNKRATREEMTIIDITLSDGTLTNILANDGTIYVMSNSDIENEEVQEEIDKLTEEMFAKEGKEVINVVYSQGYQVFNILKKGSDAEELLKDVDPGAAQEYIENIDVPVEELMNS